MSKKTNRIFMGDSLVHRMYRGDTLIYDTDPSYITFADASVAAICLAHFDMDGDSSISFDEAAMVAKVKGYKAGFVKSDSNVSPEATLGDILELKEKKGHSTVAVTEDGTAEGKLVGIVSSRDYRITRMEKDLKVKVVNSKEVTN